MGIKGYVTTTGGEECLLNDYNARVKAVAHETSVVSAPVCNSDLGLVKIWKIESSLYNKLERSDTVDYPYASR